MGQVDPLEKGMAIHSSILARESHGQRSLAGYNMWGHKESDMTEAAYHGCILLLFAMELSELATFPMKFSRQVAKLNEEH